MPYNILIVDDSSPMRAVIKKVIRASGVDIGELHEAGSGKEALTVLDDQWLDLVMTDYNMPDMNGLELLEAMKQDEMMKDIPVVMVTTEGSNDRLQTFLETGASACIRKPFTPEQIKSQIISLLGGAAHEQVNNDQCNEGLDF